MFPIFQDTSSAGSFADNPLVWPSVGCPCELSSASARQRPARRHAAVNPSELRSEAPGFTAEGRSRPVLSKQCLSTAQQLTASFQTVG